jgi:NAD(P)H-flavin reductase
MFQQQCILEILSNPADKTQITLLYVNRSPSDILLKKELDSLAAKHSNFKVVYKVDKADQSWKVPLHSMTVTLCFRSSFVHCSSTTMIQRIVACVCWAQTRAVSHNALLKSCCS